MKLDRYGRPCVPLSELGEVKWLERPEDHDYGAAEDYLTLLVRPLVAADTVHLLKHVDITHRKAKDILRASRLDLLPKSNTHVRKNLSKIELGKSLSPVLLVRSDLRLEIADGYHRVCAVFHHSEDTDIPCVLVTMAYN